MARSTEVKYSPADYKEELKHERSTIGDGRRTLRDWGIGSNLSVFISQVRSDKKIIVLLAEMVRSSH